MTSVENLSFLIVDDNLHMVSVLKVLLRAFGVRQIEECYHSTKACDAFQAARPDIVVLSSNLSPVMSLELVRRFRDFRNSPDPFVPIILVNTQSDGAHLGRARDAGVTEMVRKPVSATDLYRALDAIIHHPRPFLNVSGYFGPCRRRGDAPYEGAERRQGHASLAEMPPFTPFPQPVSHAQPERRETASIPALLPARPPGPPARRFVSAAAD
jgi:CheY-like chemotaxis protein